MPLRSEAGSEPMDNDLMGPAMTGIRFRDSDYEKEGTDWILAVSTCYPMNCV